MFLLRIFLRRWRNGNEDPSALQKRGPRPAALEAKLPTVQVFPDGRIVDLLAFEPLPSLARSSKDIQRYLQHVWQYNGETLYTQP